MTGVSMLTSMMQRKKVVPVSKSSEASKLPANNPFGADTLCCTGFYENEWVRMLLDDNFHPGGEALTRRSVAGMALPAGAVIADLGCGTGSSALLIAQETELQVHGIDRGASNIERARKRQQECGIEPTKLRFQQGDMSKLPFQNQELDAIIAECTFSLMADQPAVLKEFNRVLHPDGSLLISDMAIEGALPQDIEKVIAPWTCLVNAHDNAGYRALFEQGGFDLISSSDESAGLLSMISAIKRKLVLLGTGMAMGNLQGIEFDLATAKHWLLRMQNEVESGCIRYLGFQLRKRVV
jgi:arsenite methyltransferase